MVNSLPDIRTLEQEARVALQEALGRFGEIIENQWVGHQVGVPSDPGYDLRLRFKVKKGLGRGQIWWIHAVIKSVAHPKQAGQAIWSLKKSLGKSVEGAPVYPVLIAPFISETVAAMCEGEQIGHLDLSGNGNLEFGGIWIERRGLPRKYKEERGLKSLYSPKASRVLRVLLQGPLRAYKVEELAQASGVSLGLVSKVRQVLFEQELGDYGPDGVRITKPREILRDWILADDLRSRVETREYSLLEQDHEKIARTLHQELAGSKHAFTQWTAAHLRSPHVPPQITSLYVESFPDEERLKRTLKVRRVDGGGRLWLHRPADEGVFIGEQEVAGLPLVGDVQIYLDLLGLGDQLRANEAARELWENPDFNGGWS